MWPLRPVRRTRTWDNNWVPPPPPPAVHDEAATRRLATVSAAGDIAAVRDALAAGADAAWQNPDEVRVLPLPVPRAAPAACLCP